MELHFASHPKNDKKKQEEEDKIKLQRHINPIDSFFPFSPVQIIYQTWKRHQLQNAKSSKHEKKNWGI